MYAGFPDLSTFLNLDARKYQRRRTYAGHYPNYTKWMSQWPRIAWNPEKLVKQIEGGWQASVKPVYRLMFLPHIEAQSRERYFTLADEVMSVTDK